MLNRVILIGRLANDPESKFTPSGIAVTQFRIAVDRPLSAEARQQGQEKQADFISVVAWRQNAEFAANYLGKGRLVAVEGRLQIREFVTQDGQRRREAEVVVDNLKSLERPRDPSADQGGDEGGGGQPQQRGGFAEPAQARGGGGQDRAPATARAAAPARGGGANARNTNSTNDAFDDDMSDLSDPFAE
uniref:Single-stranded DNA-binding protein n=1 Tax=uncultured Armatimonadetes bacterium TaxID=157466 RepID=A0A6J4J297_9BACT|nr:Single-stranded DNA-binding protein [uncultured Armatimonadetes bacterium]